MNNDFNIDLFDRIRNYKFNDYDDFNVEIYEKNPGYIEVYFEDNDTYREVSNIFENDDGSFTLYYIEDNNECSVSIKIVEENLKDNSSNQEYKDNNCETFDEIRNSEINLSAVICIILFIGFITYFITKRF